MNNKLTIYCCYHNKNQIKDYDLKETDNFKIFYGPDGLLNNYLSEFSMFYNIWKNDKDSDYIGTCHYKRKINVDDFNINKVNQNECQVYEIINTNIEYNSGIYGIERWTSDEWFQCEWLWKDYKTYTNKKYGMNNDFLKTDKLLYNFKFPKYKSFMVSRSSFILTREHFMNMCDYIFGFLDYIDKKYKLNYDANKYKRWIYDNWYLNTNENLPWKIETKPNDIKRFLAFFMEWMSSIYIQTKIKEYNLINSYNNAFCFLTNKLNNFLVSRILDINNQISDSTDFWLLYDGDKSTIDKRLIDNNINIFYIDKNEMVNIGVSKEDTDYRKNCERFLTYFYYKHSEYDYYYLSENDVIYNGNYKELIYKYDKNHSDILIQNDVTYNKNLILNNGFYKLFDNFKSNGVHSIENVFPNCISEMNINGNNANKYPYKRIFQFYRCSNRFLKKYLNLVINNKISGHFEWTYIATLLEYNFSHDYFNEKMYSYFKWRGLKPVDIELKLSGSSILNINNCFVHHTDFICSNIRPYIKRNKDYYRNIIDRIKKRHQ